MKAVDKAIRACDVGKYHVKMKKGDEKNGIAKYIIASGKNLEGLKAWIKNKEYDGYEVVSKNFD